MDYVVKVLKYNDKTLIFDKSVNDSFLTKYFDTTPIRIHEYRVYQTLKEYKDEVEELNFNKVWADLSSEQRRIINEHFLKKEPSA